MKHFSIAGQDIGDGLPAFIIAEVGINHNGSIDLAMKMIGVAKKAGADAVKFQTFKATEFVGDKSQQFTYRSQGRQVTESMQAMFQRYERDMTFVALARAALGEDTTNETPAGP